MPAESVFGALANPTRRKILELLLAGPLSAGDIASRFALNRPAVSEHVHVLCAAGLVTEEERGRHRFYHLDARPLSAVGEWMQP
ncbi:MAG TPA: metalloregulator ArsR/SmtB family transcription factor, partial [bacterium]|nr:metalloregulator ArsR/SmtB family transcription factor [bacterium]